jgi:hypothetical protein
MPGPPPKPDAERRRRNPVPGMVLLPARGRRGRSPAWPLEVVPKPVELELWSRLWHTPQAVAWERFEWSRVVARYVRVVVEAEDELDVKLLAEARQLEDRLGLNPLAMLRLRWSVTDDEVAEQRAPKASGRRRLRAVE